MHCTALFSCKSNIPDGLRKVLYIIIYYSIYHYAIKSPFIVLWDKKAIELGVVVAISELVTQVHQGRASFDMNNFNRNRFGIWLRQFNPETDTREMRIPDYAH